MAAERHYYQDNTPPSPTGERPQTPQERTTTLFRSSITRIATVLEDSDVVRVLPNGAEVKLQLGRPIPWSQYGSQYQERLDPLQPGDVAVRRFTGRGLKDTNQTLIRGAKPGECIQIKKVRRYDQDQNKYVSVPNEGDIARELYAKDGDTFCLQYVDDSNVLHLVDKPKDIPHRQTPEESAHALEQYFTVEPNENQARE